jgi:hypothetical protein
VTADFSGQPFPLPPGIQEPPSFTIEVEQPCWVSSVANPRVHGLGQPGRHVVTGGRTLWLDDEKRPASIVVSHPNRLGASEDLGAMIDIATRWRTSVWVDVDPYLVPMVEIPEPLHGLVRWDRAVPWDLTGKARERVAARCLLAADSFRRRVAQIPRVKFVAERQSGRAVSLITPLPGEQVVQRLEANGALVDILPIWEGVVIVWLGWWHTRRQIDQLATAVADAVDGAKTFGRISSNPIDEDDFDRMPGDLPRRRLDTI